MSRTSQFCRDRAFRLRRDGDAARSHATLRADHGCRETSHGDRIHGVLGAKLRDRTNGQGSLARRASRWRSGIPRALSGRRSAEARASLPDTWSPTRYSIARPARTSTARSCARSRARAAMCGPSPATRHGIAPAILRVPLRLAPRQYRKRAEARRFLERIRATTQTQAQGRPRRALGNGG